VAGLIEGLVLVFVVACNSAPPAASPVAGNSPAAATTDNYPSLAVQAKEVNDALLRKDYQKVLDLTYPKVIELAGGRDKMLATMTKELKDIEAEGVTLISSSAGTPTQFLHDAGKIYAVLPLTLKVKAKDGVFQSSGALIGISADGGQNWTFIDASGKDQKELKTLLAETLDKLKLPSDSQPVKVSDSN
jgi:hypothetical protein